MPRLTKKQAKEYFKWAKQAEDRYWTSIRAFENDLRMNYGDCYELAVVSGCVVGIGKITKKGRKMIIERDYEL